MITQLPAWRQVVFTSLKFGCKLLWDECCRREYLDSVEKVRDMEGYEVYAFSIFSDRFCAVTGKFGEYPEQEACMDQMRILKHFLENSDLPSQDRNQFLNGDGPALFCCSLVSSEDVQSAVIYVHLLAQNLHYIRYGTGYWWSSVQTYRQRYRWDIVDTSLVLDEISPDRAHARRVFIRKHGQASRAGNPLPECLKDLRQYSLCDKPDK